MSSNKEKIQDTDLVRYGPGDNTGLHLWLILWKCWTAVHRYAIVDIETLGLGLSDFGILEILLHKGPMAVNEIGARINLTSGSMTVAVDRLEKRGLVERHDNAGDRRSRVVHLTSQGTRLITSAFAEHARTMNRLGEILTETERKTAMRILKKLGKAAEQAAHDRP